MCEVLAHKLVVVLRFGGKLADLPGKISAGVVNVYLY